MMVGCADIARARCNRGAATFRAAAIPRLEHPKIVCLEEKGFSVATSHRRSTTRALDLTLARWASGKFKSLRGHKRRSRHWLARIARHQPRLFAHWGLLYGRGRTMGAG